MNTLERMTRTSPGRSKCTLIERSAFGTLVAAAIAVSLTTSPPAAHAYRGDCGQPLSNSSKLVVSDCLWILQAAVQLTTCSPACICRPTGNPDNTTASDALLCLQHSVNLPATLACPCPEGCQGDAPAAVERGREALENRQLKRATAEFDCAVQDDPDDSEANFFFAITRLLEYFARNPEAQALLDAFGTGNRDIYDYAYKFFGDLDPPLVAEIEPVVLQSLDDELIGAIENLAVAKTDSAFRTVLTDRMLDDILASNDRLELDAADGCVISAFLNLARFAIYFSLAYTDQTIDDPLQDLDGVFGTNCGDTYLDENPNFFTVEDTDKLLTAKAAFTAWLDDLICALDAVAAEGDSQADDLFLADDVPPLGDDRALGLPETAEREILMALRDSMSRITTDMPGCSLGFRFFLRNLFNTPLNRDDLPTLGKKATGSEFGPLCGDGECQLFDESSYSCAIDCGCAAGGPGACGGIAPDGCSCAPSCVDDGTCCQDACEVCRACDSCPDIIGELPDPDWNFIFPGQTSLDSLKDSLSQTGQCIAKTGVAPPNDDCEGADTIDSVPFAAMQLTPNATVVPGEPFAGCINGGSNTVWYKLTAPSDGTIEIDPSFRIYLHELGLGFLGYRLSHLNWIGTDYFTATVVYSGSCGELTPITCGYPFNDIQFDVVEGETYYVQIASDPSDGGGFLMLTARYIEPSSLTSTTIGSPHMPTTTLDASFETTTTLGDVTSTTTRFGRGTTTTTF